MEHITLTRGGSLTKNDIVPYVATEDYKHTTLTEFLDKEWPADVHKWATTRCEGDVNVILQTWFFFGLFKQLLGPFFVSSDYVTTRTRPGGYVDKIVTTASLRSAIESWVEYARHNLDRAAFWVIYSRVFNIFSRDLHPAVLLGDDVRKYSRSEDHVAIMTSIHSAASLLSVHLKFMSESAPIPGPYKTVLQLWVIDLALMVKSGWCPSVVSELWYGLPIEAQMMLRTAPNPDVDHKAHNTCDFRLPCQQAQIGPEFISPHTEDGCECGIWTVNSEVLCGIILDGKLPLLQFTFPQDGRKLLDIPFDELHLSLVSSDGDTPFVALSHVWAHGLGNRQANGLPRCRIHLLMSRISEFWKGQDLSDTDLHGLDCDTDLALVKDLDPKFAARTRGVLLHEHYQANVAYFWLDTLCCPAQQGLSKRLAISRLKDVYQGASDVLVLDRCLESLLASEHSPTELAMYIALSSWAQRGWTLQEGVLARRLWICFRDSYQRVDWLIFQLRLAIQVPRSTTAAYSFLRILEKLNGGWLKSLTKRPTVAFCLRNTIEAVKSRSLSVKSDEAICLFNLITASGPLSPAETATEFNTASGSDTSSHITSVTSGATASLHHEDEDDSMARFWDECRRRDLIDPDIIFNPLPKMSKKGYRWAPASLMSATRGVSLSMSMIGAKSLSSWSIPCRSGFDIISCREPREVETERPIDVRGIVAEYNGMILKPNSTIPFRRQLEMSSSKNVTLIRDGASGKWYKLSPSEPSLGTCINALRIRDDMTIALIMAHSPELRANVLVTSVLESRGGSHQVYSLGLAQIEPASLEYTRAMNFLFDEPMVEHSNVTAEAIQLMGPGHFGSEWSNMAVRKIHETVVRFHIMAVSEMLVRKQYLEVATTIVAEDHTWIVD